MKKRLLLSAMCIAVMLFAHVQASPWDGSHVSWSKGNGTQANPYLIENASHLAHLAYIVNNGMGAGGGRIVGAGSYWKLTADIDLNGNQGQQWTPIGYSVSSADYYAFGGNFDGDGHTVGNLYINDQSLERAGLFGYTDGAVIASVGVADNSSVAGGMYVGGVVAYADNTLIDHCYNLCNLSASTSPTNRYVYAGGIVGYSDGTTINHSYNTGNISTLSNNSLSYFYIGGVAGYSQRTTINNSHNTGNLSSPASSSYTASGGIIGQTTMTVDVNNSYNLGTVSSHSNYNSAYSGGIIGHNAGTITVNNSYNTGTIIANAPVNGWAGAIVGYRGGITTVVNTYYLNTCGGDDRNGGVSRTEVLMKEAEFAKILNNERGFIFKSDTEPYANGGYPVLTRGFDMQLRGMTDVTQTKATLKCMLQAGDVDIKSRQLVCGNQVIDLPSNDTLLIHTVSGLLSDTEYTYTFRAVNADNDTCKLTGGFMTLPVTTWTGTATAITQTQATLAGKVTFGDATVSKGFEYKLSADTEYTRVVVTASGEDMTCGLAHLQPGQFYQFRAFCEVDGKVIYDTMIEEPREFMTLQVAVFTHPASEITRSTATLNGNIHAGDATILEQGFVLTTTEGDSIISTGDMSPLLYELTDLPRGKAFRYETFCTTVGGTVYGEEQHFSTLAFNSDGTNFFIENKDDLILLANLVNGGNTFSGQTFVLQNDITLPTTPNNILSIGNKNTESPFSGTFHGNGKRIYNVYIDEPNTPYQGFFGYTQNAFLYEVGLVDITASGRNYTGGMVGYAENTRINDSYVSGGTLFALSYCGGLIGYQTPGTNSIISGCYNTCTVTGINYVGGLLGYSDHGTVRNSYVAALVTGSGNGVGAIIGGAEAVLNYNCYFNDSITGQTYAIGENWVERSLQQKSTPSASDQGGMSSGDMRMQSFVNTLNKGLVTPVWKADYTAAINSGFPILIWQGEGKTGLGISKATPNISLYPNPVNSVLHVGLDREVLNGMFTLYDMNGKTVMSRSLNGSSAIIDMSQLRTGNYILRLSENGKANAGVQVVKE